LFGIGFLFHWFPCGVVKVSDGIESVAPLVLRTLVLLSANSSWWDWKHASVGASPAGQSL